CSLLPPSVWPPVRHRPLIFQEKLRSMCRQRRLQLLGPDVTSVPTSAEYLPAARRISVLLDRSIPTPILALLAAVRLAAIINSPADGCSASAICLMGAT